jgi:hypothetical protein
LNPHVLSDTSPSNSRGCRYTTWARDLILRAADRATLYGSMRIFRCPRCRAEDISADAHPTRVLDNGVERPIFVCRNCYRAAELEFRIASQTADLGYVPLAIRDGLRQLRDFYSARLVDDDGDPRVRTALAEVERRLAIDVV